MLRWMAASWGKENSGQIGDDHPDELPGKEYAEAAPISESSSDSVRSWRTRREAAGANGGADAELAAAAGSAGQQKDGYVAAADEQKQGHGAKHEVKSAADVVHEVFIEADDGELHGVSGKCLGVSLRKASMSGARAALAWAWVIPGFRRSPT